MPFNRARHRRAAESAKRRRASTGRFLKLKDDTNRVRLFPFDHVVNEFDVHLGRYNKADLKEGADVGTTQQEIYCEFSKHFLGKSGHVICTGDAGCPVCEDAKQVAVEEGNKSERASSLKARSRYVFNAVDTDAPDLKMQVLEVPTTVWEEILENLNDPELEEDELLGCTGRDFVIKRDPDAPPAKMYTVRLREPKRCKELPASLLAGVADLYLMPDFLPGYGLADFEPPEEFEQAAKAAGKKAARPGAPKRRAADADKTSADEEAAIQIGARVSVTFEDGTYEGVIEAVDEEGARVTFDDGEAQDVPLDEITVLAGKEDADETSPAEEEEEDEAGEKEAEDVEADVVAEDEEGDTGEGPGEEDAEASGALTKGSWVKFMLDGKPAYGQIVGDPDVNGVFEVMLPDGREFEMDETEAEPIKEGDVPEVPSAVPKKPRAALEPPPKKKMLKKKVVKKTRRI
jgi:hypothetical protein